MPPVEFIENQIPAGETTQVKFVRNTPYEGVDYGPDYDEQIASVESRQARIWIERGRAVLVSGETVEPVEAETVESLAKMRKDDLVALAVSRGIETVPDELTKVQIAQLIVENAE